MWLSMESVAFLELVAGQGLGSSAAMGKGIGEDTHQLFRDSFQLCFSLATWLWVKPHVCFLMSRLSIPIVSTQLDFWAG